MANKKSKESYWDPEFIADVKLWESDIRVGNYLRKRYPPIILSHRSADYDALFEVPCPACKYVLKGRQNNYGMPLSEGVIECPIGEATDGHGWWASIINVMDN